MVHRQDEPPREGLNAPLSFDQLNDALESAHDEVQTLQKQYDELQALVTEKFGKGKTCERTSADNAGSRGSSASQVKNSGDEPGPSCVQKITSLVDVVVEPQVTNAERSDRRAKLKLCDGIVDEVAQLSEQEAKRALTVGVIYPS